MEHKAFIFDYQFFLDDLSEILNHALKDNETFELIKFIEKHRQELRDPYEGEPLLEDWIDTIEFGTPEEYGDFALTRYYEPAKDMGLGYEWEEIDDCLERLGESFRAAVLGRLFGSKDNVFDPGKMGSYFQSPEQIKENLLLLQEGLKRHPELAILKKAIAMLKTAAEEGKGLYVTF